MRILLIGALSVAVTGLLPGCLGAFASNQGRRQAARSADHYVRAYAPESDDPAVQAEMRRTRNDIADTIVRTGNDRQVNRVGVNDRGWLTEER